MAYLMGLILRAIDESKMDMKQDGFCLGHRMRSLDSKPPLRRGYPPHPAWQGSWPLPQELKLYNPELCVMVVSGDGDLSSIGGNHLIHAARRDIDLKVICANNMIYGMTGGQVASTTPSRSPNGDDRRRESLISPSISPAWWRPQAHRMWQNIRCTQPVTLVRSIKKAIQHVGFSFIEVLSPCPTQYREEESHRPAGGYDSRSHREVHSGGGSEGTDSKRNWPRGS